VGIAALVLGIVGIVLCIIPSFSVTQMIGGLVSIVAIVLAIVGRRRIFYQHQSTGIATAGLVLGIVALVFNSAVFASCQYCQHRVGDELRRGLQEGVRDGARELDREVERALKARPQSRPAVEPPAETR